MREQTQDVLGRGVSTPRRAASRVLGVVSGLWQFTRRKPLGGVGLWVCIIILIVAIFAPVIAPYDPLGQMARDRLQSPSFKHLLGTDEFGRDVLSRVIYGARVSLIVAFFAVGIGSSLGLVLGLISGYLGGRVDAFMQRVVEIQLSFPALILALLIVSVWGAGIEKVIAALAAGYIAGPTRIIRGTVLSVKENVYVEAARAIGVGQWTIMFRHLLPNIFPVYLIIASAALGAATLAEASLSFLGLGVPPPAPSWGRMLSGGAQTYGAVAPWMVLAPGVAISLMVLAFNLFGDALRDVWDPRLRGTGR